MAGDRLDELGIPRRSFLKKSVGAVFVAPVVVSFALDGVAEARTSALPNQPHDEPTTLVAAPAKRGLLTITFSATLTRSSNSAPLWGERIVFSIDGRDVGNATTNSSGVASSTVIGLAITIGKDAYTASFAGDSTYLPSSSSADL